MITLLRKIFIKNYKDITNTKIRQKHGRLAGVLGIITNIILFVIKLIFGILSNSISIIIDAFNNLSDMASSIINLVCFKLSSIPADEEHPHGHERIEYIAGLIISIIIIVVGLQLGYQGILKIINKSQMTISLSVIIILGISIILKLWQALMNYKLGKLIDSLSLKTTYVDSRNDAIITFSILICAIINYFYPKIFLDGYLGVVLSLFVIYSGIKMIKNTSKPLIGENIDRDLVKEILYKILNYDPLILGVHDISNHKYGPNNKYMIVHVEISDEMSLRESHLLIDSIEKLVYNDYRINLVIHVDPVDTKCNLTEKLKEITESCLSMISGDLSFHDFRVEKLNNRTSIYLDIVIPSSCKIEKDIITKILSEHLKRENKGFELFINYDEAYVDYGV